MEENKVELEETKTEVEATPVKPVLESKEEKKPQNEKEEYAVEVENISKSYGSHLVLNNVSMHIRKGDIYGFVGPNGSGKTTIIRIITGLTHPSSGSYKIFGVSSKSLAINEARKKTNAIVESPSIYLNMNAHDNIQMQAMILGEKFSDERINELLKIVGLGDVEPTKKAANYSLGMRQRLGIAMCLVNSPEFLILDEPLNGLDPEGIVGIRNLILDLNKNKGITFFISSHILTELNLVANRFGIIKAGKLIKEISREELDGLNTKETTIKTSNNELAFNLIVEKFSSLDVTKNDEYISIMGEFDMNSIIAEFVSNSINILDIKTKETSIEEYYISIAGGNNND